MTVEQASANVEAIVRWINETVTSMDRPLHYGFGDFGVRRFPDHHREWDLSISKDGKVSIESVFIKGDFDRFEGSDTRYYPHYSYSDLAIRELSGANDLMTEWPLIKSKILGEVERLRDLEDFHV